MWITTLARRDCVLVGGSLWLETVGSSPKNILRNATDWTAIALTGRCIVQPDAVLRWLLGPGAWFPAVHQLISRLDRGAVCHGCLAHFGL
jgi:hypothetical protein